jgi:ribosomal protein L11 methyltransferase
MSELTKRVASERRWAALELTVEQENEDLACWLLIKLGAQGCVVNPVSLKSISIVATFECESIEPAVWEEIKSSLEEYGLANSLASLRRRDVSEEDWLAKWKEGFEPFAVGDKFLICPSWYKPGYVDDYPEELKKHLPPAKLDEAPPVIDGALAAGRFLIFIEPGMAFGTGLHATTQFCLRAIEKFPPQGDVLDVGTGSGILAMAALALSPSCKIAAVDTDPVAVDFAAKDFKLNEVTDKIELLEGSTDVVKGRQFDVLLSNLTCEDIIALLPDYQVMLKPGGLVLCAGILEEKLPRLEAELGKHSLKVVHREQVGHWVGVVLAKE